MKSLSKKNLLNEAAWSLSGKIISALGTLVGVRLLTEYVHKEIYGKVGLLVAAMTLGMNLFASPITSAAQRFYSDQALRGQVPLLRNTLISLLKWPTVILGTAILLLMFFARSIPDSVLLTLAFLLVFQVIYNLEVSLLTAARRQKEVAFLGISQTWLKPGFAVLAIIVLGVSPFSILLGYSIATGGILLLFYLLPVQVEGVSRSSKPLKPDRNLVNNIFRYSFPLMPLALVSWTSSLSDRYIIGGTLGLGQVGIYAAGYGLISMPFLMVEGIIGQTLRPAYFQSVSSIDSITGKKILRYHLIMTVGICGIGVLAVCFFKNLLAQLFLAKEYREATILLPWIAVGISFQVISQIFEGVLIAYKKTLRLLMVHSLGAVISVVSVFLLCSRFGLPGAAMACPLYYLSMVVAGIALTSKLIK
jgi:O-antigen/teichoic acid export membrane protein